jgi:hypothetical protein
MRQYQGSELEANYLLKRIRDAIITQTFFFVALLLVQHQHKHSQIFSPDLAACCLGAV